MTWFVNKTIPAAWDCRYLLRCVHSLPQRDFFYYMYCDVLKFMPDGRAKIKVYGVRYTSTQGERIRYVDAGRVVLACEWLG